MLFNFLTAGRRFVSSPNMLPSAITRVHEAARTIKGRVRDALLPGEVEFPPMRAMVVDDHLDTAESLARVLELLDCPTVACHDGRSALEVAAGFRPQVCLLDLVMPRMDGLELAARLREQAGGRAMLLVAVTALGAMEARVATALAGFHAHLTKPVDAAELINVLARLGEKFRSSIDGPPTEA